MLVQNQHDQAEETLSQMNPDQPEVILAEYQLIGNQIRQLQTEAANSQTTADAETDKLQNQRIALLEKLLAASPESAPIPLDALRYSYEHNNNQQAVNLLDKYITYINPDKITFNSTYIQAQILKVQAQEPNPLNISSERNSAIVYSVLSSVSDNDQRTKLLASYYKGINDDQKAFEYYKKAYDLEPDNDDLLSELFEAALKIEDKQTAQSLANKAKTDNVDGCNGLLFSCRIDMMNKDYEAAILKLNQCVELRPVAPIIYLLRSQCNTAVGNHENAIDDAKTAQQMNFLDGQIAKVYVSAVAARNDAVSPNVSLQQEDELQKAISNAIVLNPTRMATSQYVCRSSRRVKTRNGTCCKTAAGTNCW